MTEWQPIETAPRDGTIILGLVCIGTHSEAPAYEPQPMYHVGLVMWTREAFRFREPRVMPATHWQPFNPPQQA